MAAANVDVQVTLSERELALAEVKSEEHQRLAGFLPNFFVTYDWNAAPLSSKQKYELAWKTTLDPATLVVAGAVAGLEQVWNDFPGYRQGARGYGKRYGAALADTAVGTFWAARSCRRSCVRTHATSIKGPARSGRAPCTLWGKRSFAVATMDDGSRTIPASWEIWPRAAYRTCTIRQATAVESD